jgi:phytoene desaturase
MKKATIIGSGFSGLASASLLAQKGIEVTVLEKNNQPGGRARYFAHQGFTFDMGPSWYWMPDVFESYFNLFEKTTADFYELKQLSPSYSIFFGKNQKIDIPATEEGLYELFEKLEPGSAGKLKMFLKEAAYKYEVGINNLVYKPGASLLEFADVQLIKGIFRLHVFRSFSSYVKKYFKDKRLISLLEFPILFLGALPQNTPALYSLMNYAGLSLGTWYPMGGMYKIIDAMLEICREQGVKFQTSTNAEKIIVQNGLAKGIQTNNGYFESDVTVGSADYHHIEQRLLPPPYRKYKHKYWNSRVMAPSCLIFYIGVNKKVANLEHHNLFFDEDFGVHAKEIYESPQWPSNPLFYVCCPSKTDNSVAPEGHENLFILMPIASGLEDNPDLHDYYFHNIMERLESITAQSIKPNIIYKKNYSISDFRQDYNAFKGNAYGLANTLFQTAIFKPSMRNKKVKNLFYTGQLTVPGPGVPPSLISGQVAAKEVLKFLNINI